MLKTEIRNSDLCKYWFIGQNLTLKFIDLCYFNEFNVETIKFIYWFNEANNEVFGVERI